MFSRDCLQNPQWFSSAFKNKYYADRRLHGTILSLTLSDHKNVRNP